MQSKTSYFSKAIFCKNMTRFWPLWGAYFLICMIKLPLRLFYALKIRDLEPGVVLEEYRLSQLENVVNTALHPLLLFLFAAIAAIAVFSYLYQQKSCHMLHAFPVCRETLFFTNALSGICFLTIPQAAAFLTGIFVCFFRHMTQLEYLMHYLVLSVGMAFFAFALAVCMVMIAGNMVAAAVFDLIANFLFVGCQTVVSELLVLMSYGMDEVPESFGVFLSPYYYLSTLFPDLFQIGWSETDLSKAYVAVTVYFMAALLLFALSMLVYRRKHLETAGDVLTVSGLKPVFRWGAAFCAGCLVTICGQFWLVGDYFSGKNLLLLLILMLLGSGITFFLAEMLLQKKFFVFCRKKLLEWGIGAAIFCGFLIGVDFNVFGFETWLPKEEDLEMVFVSGIYPIRVEEEDFSQVLQIHENLIENKTELQRYFQKYQDNCRKTTLKLVYTMKDGRVQTRSYQIPVEDYYLAKEDYAFNLLTELSDCPEYYLRYHFTEAYEAITFVDGSLDVLRQEKYLEGISLDQEQCRQIYAAFRKDIEEGNYKIYDYALCDQSADRVYYNTLSLTYHVPRGSGYVFYGGVGEATEAETLQAAAISLTTDCEHTLQILKELGILESEKNLITQEEADYLYDEELPAATVYH